jgi:hypothetical protein
MSNPPLPPHLPVLRQLQSHATPGGAPATATCLAPVSVAPGRSIPPVAYRPERPASLASASQHSPRCTVKGCVFPASSPGDSVCRYHELLRSPEAGLFESHQPTYSLSLQAPFGVPDHEPDDSRHKDRERWAAEREAFIFDEPTEP